MYTNAKFELVFFNSEDVITTSDASSAITNPEVPEVSVVPTDPPVVNLPVVDIPYDEREDLQ